MEARSAYSVALNPKKINLHEKMQIFFVYIKKYSYLCAEIYLFTYYKGKPL